MVDADTIRAMLEQRPFTPFVVHLTRGARHTVRDPKHTLLNKSMLTISAPDSDKTLSCPLKRIIKVEPV